MDTRDDTPTEQSGKRKGKGVGPDISMAMYVGDGAVKTNTICCLAFGEPVRELPVGAAGHPVELKQARLRPGAKHAVFIEPRTKVVQQLERTSTLEPMRGSYDLAMLATKAWVRDQTSVGDYVDMYLQRVQVETKWTTADGAPYLQLHGVDADGDAVGPVRLWRFEDGDVREHSAVVLRGLKVVHPTAWDETQWTYVPQKDGPNAVECSYRTAVEHVAE